MPGSITWPLPPASPGNGSTTPVRTVRAPYGVDTSAVPDLDLLFVPQTGPRVLAEAIARRLSTPRGGLFYDPSYGLDLRDYLNAKFGRGDETRLRAAIANECIKDERILSADATVSLNVALQTLTLSLKLTTANGPFSLTLAISAVTTTILNFAAG
jgi:phage baseplate assembly protein W